jgi:hypothetical protein
LKDIEQSSKSSRLENNLKNYRNRGSLRFPVSI